MASSSTILSPLSRDRGDDKATRKNAANGHVFSDSRRPSLLRAGGDAQWKRWGWLVEKMGILNGSDGGGQWKRWGRSVEKMGMASGKDGDAQWKRWGWLVEKMGTASGKDGDG